MPLSFSEKRYRRSECVVFWKTREAFGGLSNMAGGFPLSIAGIPVRTAEALYQACKFPGYPDAQREILGQKSPLFAAKVGRRREQGRLRTDWPEIKIEVMRWCLRVKLAQNWAPFSALLESSGARAIVEQSRKDPFWGAIALGEGELVGQNVLGQLLVELREGLREKGSELAEAMPPSFPGFRLLGEDFDGDGLRRQLVIECRQMRGPS